VKPAHDTPLPFNFKYFFVAGLGIEVRPSRCGAAGPALIGFVALTSRRRKSGGGKRLSAGTPDISTLKSNAGTSIEFRSIKSRDACLAPAWHATPWFIASRLILDDGSLLDPTTWALVALMPARVQFTRDRHEPGHQAIGRPPGSRARRIFFPSRPSSRQASRQEDESERRPSRHARGSQTAKGRGRQQKDAETRKGPILTIFK
jgi:hypothetical protein